MSILGDTEKFILILSQRDISHNKAGGAEMYLHNALKVLASEVNVVHIGMLCGSHTSSTEIIDGVMYMRKGRNLVITTLEGIAFYFKHRKQIIAVIDHSNTHQFFSFLWARKKRIFFIHQLAVEIWDYFLGKYLGKILRSFEEILIRLSKGDTITVSESTKKDLVSRGFTNVVICPEGNLPKNLVIPSCEKEGYLIYFGRVTEYKRVEYAIRLSHEVGKKLYILGRGSIKYNDKLKSLISELNADVEVLGYISKEVKDEIIKKAELLVMPSIREGWGLVITESANLGTPSIVFPVNGVIEAVNYGEAGFLTKGLTCQDMIDRYKEITPEQYSKMRLQAFEYSLKFTWDATAISFRDNVKRILENRGVLYSSILKLTE